MWHSFDAEIAREYGIEESILLCNLHWWCSKNRANGRNFFHGNWWTYNSVKAFSELFPYMSRSAVSRALANLERDGLIETGNFNKDKYDRTKWYALTEKAYAKFGESISQKSEMGFEEIENGVCKTSEPIPDGKPDGKPVQKQGNLSQGRDGKAKGERGGDVLAAIEAYTENRELRLELSEFAAMRRRMKKPLTRHAMELLLTGKSGLDSMAASDEDKIRIVQKSVASSWQGFFPLKGGGGQNARGDTGFPDGFFEKMDRMRGEAL